MCLHICTYVSICIYVCAYVYTLLNVYVYAHVYVYVYLTYTCMRMCRYLNIYTRADV